MITLTPEDIEAIASAVAAKLATSPASGPTAEVRAKPAPTGIILTRKEAMAFVKMDSRAGFYQWLKRYQVEGSGRDRYPAHRLEQGLAREARMKVSERKTS